MQTRDCAECQHIRLQDAERLSHQRRMRAGLSVNSRVLGHEEQRWKEKTQKRLLCPG